MFFPHMQHIRNVYCPYGLLRALTLEFLWQQVGSKKSKYLSAVKLYVCVLPVHKMSIRRTGKAFSNVSPVWESWILYTMVELC